MDKDDKKELARDLKGRQSIRATFRLTERAINAISIVAAHLGIKQKSLFDHLIDDTRALNSIADGIKSDKFSKLKRIQKTYVLSRKTMLCLEAASKDLDAPRDALVEYSIQRLLPVIDEEREKHLKHKKILCEITEYVKQGEKILKKSIELLGQGDPVHDRFESAMTVLNSAHSSIESFIEKGKIIENF
jgi:hypothetical protein